MDRLCGRAASLLAPAGAGGAGGSPIDTDNAIAAGEPDWVEHGPPAAASPHAGDAHAVAPTIEAAAVAYLFRNVRTAAAANVVLAGFVVVALWPDVASGVLLGWLSLILGANAVRLALHARYRRLDQPDPGVWRRRYTAALIASGAAWGAAAPLFALGVSPLQQMVLVIAIAGLTAGGLPMNAVVLRTYVGFLVAATLPVAATYLVHGLAGAGGREHLVLAIMTLVYTLALIVAARTYNADQRGAYALSARLRAANRALEHRASHDALTGLWNRDRFELALDQEFDRKARYGGRFSVVMLDIDRFKRVNDDYGHDVGDTVLCELARLLCQTLRGPDQAGRWGGEEFLVLLPETPIAEASQLAERLRADFATIPFTGPGRVTISLGVTSSDAREDRTELLKRLDDALYGAKQRGRNRIETLAQPEPAG